MFIIPGIAGEQVGEWCLLGREQSNPDPESGTEESREDSVCDINRTRVAPKLMDQRQAGYDCQACYHRSFADANGIRNTGVTPHASVDTSKREYDRLHHEDNWKDQKEPVQFMRRDCKGEANGICEQQRYREHCQVCEQYYVEIPVFELIKHLLVSRWIRSVLRWHVTTNMPDVQCSCEAVICRRIIRRRL